MGDVGYMVGYMDRLGRLAVACLGGVDSMDYADYRTLWRKISVNTIQNSLWK
jgi:hypothetical protein